MSKPCPEGYPHRHPDNVVEEFYWRCLGLVVLMHLRAMAERRGWSA